MRSARIGGAHAKLEGETVAIVCMEEILACLDDAHVRCTYGAVGEAIGVPHNRQDSTSG